MENPCACLLIPAMDLEIHVLCGGDRARLDRTGTIGNHQDAMKPEV